MATNNIQENLKKFFYQGVGLAAHTTEVVQKSVAELVKKGKVSEADGKKLVAEAIKKVESQRPALEAKYNETVHKFVKLSASEVGKLQKRVEQLEKQLTIKKGGASKPAAKPAAKATAKPVAKKKAAKKVVKKASAPSPAVANNG
jgi:polyhydroxyalkanoate synthesis regulator phasin